MGRFRLLLPAFVVAVVALVATVVSVAAPSVAADRVSLTLFWLEGCPHCAAERAFLADLTDRQPDLDVVAYEVSSSENLARLRATASRLGFEPSGVPVTVLGDRYWIGFNDAIGAEIERAVSGALVGERATPRSAEQADREVVDVPFLGDVRVDNRPLLVATVLIAFVDGVNPCSLWVLSVLLALVLHSGSRRRVAAVGITFLTVTAALYGLYIAGIYTALAYAAYLAWIQRGVAVLAAGFGAINVKDYYASGRGPSLSIADRFKPGIYRRSRALAAPDRALPAVLGATAALAVGVSLVETPCTAGFPVIWTNMLSAADVGVVPAAGLFAVYMAVFLLDELAVFTVAVVTMRVAKLQEHHGRTLKLVGGVVMLALAVAMFVDPETLSTGRGAVAVFGIATAVVAVLLAVERWRTRRVRTPSRGRPGRRGRPLPS